VGVVPDLQRPEHEGAVGQHHLVGDAVEEEDPGASVLEVAAEPLAHRGNAHRPILAELVARGPGLGVADLPEAVDERIALVIPREREKGGALLGRDEDVHLFQPGAVLLGERLGEQGCREKEKEEREEPHPLSPSPGWGQGRNGRGGQGVRSQG
jgi:hypothetical protein